MNRTGMAALGLVCVLLLAVVFAPLPGSTVGIRALHDFAHAPIFGCIALLLLVALRAFPRLDRLPWQRHYSLACIGASVLGGLTELAQIPVGRDSSWLDVRSDVMGAAAFLALFSLFDRRVRRASIRVAGVIIGVALLVLHSLPVIIAWLAYARRADAYPVLADYTRAADLYFVEQQRSAAQLVSMPAEWARSPDESALQVSFGAGPWPGLNFFEPAPDWRGHVTLVLDITNPTDEVLHLVFRVHDARHNYAMADRFNRALNVAPRTRMALRMPLAEIAAAPRARTLDLRNVAGVILFRSADSTAPRMYVSRLALE